MTALLLAQQVPTTTMYPIGSLDRFWYLRAAASLLVALLVLLWARTQILSQEHKGQIAYVIAFNIAMFVVVGFALTITASREWATACLCAGASLLSGGFLGLLFGVPYGRTTSEMMAKAQAVTDAGNAGGGAGGNGGANPPAPAAGGAQGAGALQVAAAQAGAGGAVPDPNAPQAAGNPPAQGADLNAAPAAPDPGNPAPAATGDNGQNGNSSQASAVGRNLLEDTASSLSKLLTGASLVKIGDLYRFFQATSWKVGYYLTDGNLYASGANRQYVSANIAVMGGALILYFLILGFLSGLFLPAYFMKGWDD